MDENLSLSEFLIASEELNNINSEIDDLLTRMSIGNATEYSVEENNLEALSNIVDYDLGLESDDYTIFKARVDTVLDQVSQVILTKFKALSPLVNLTTGYRTSELMELKRKILAKELIVNPVIDPKKIEVLNRKLAVFYSAGYNVENNCSQLIDFMNNIVLMTNVTGKYLSSLKSMYDSLNAPGEQTVPKMSGLLNVKNSLGGLVDTIDRKYNVTDYRMSIVSNWFGSRAELFTITYSSRKGRGFKVGADIYDVKLHRDIEKANDNDTIRLLDYAIKHQSKLPTIHKAISFNVKSFTRNNVMQLIKSSSGNNSQHRFMVARYSEGVIKSLINLYRNVMSFDLITIAYINCVYKQAPGTNTVNQSTDKNKIVVDTTKHN